MEESSEEQDDNIKMASIELQASYEKLQKLWLYIRKTLLIPTSCSVSCPSAVTYWSGII